MPLYRPLFVLNLGLPLVWFPRPVLKSVSNTMVTLFGVVCVIDWGTLPLAAFWQSNLDWKSLASPKHPSSHSEASKASPPIKGLPKAPSPPSPSHGSSNPFASLQALCEENCSIPCLESDSKDDLELAQAKPIAPVPSPDSFAALQIAEDIIHPELSLGEEVVGCHQNHTGSSSGSVAVSVDPNDATQDTSVRGKASWIVPSKDDGLPVHVGRRVENYEFSVEPLNSEGLLQTKAPSPIRGIDFWNVQEKGESALVLYLKILEDLNYDGAFFTWNEGREYGSHAYRKLDRVVVNGPWLMELNYKASLPPAKLSDHSPCILSLLTMRHPKVG